MKHSVLLVAVAILLLTGCSSVPTKDIAIVTHTNFKANLGVYKTYAWKGSATTINDPQGLWEPPAFDADTELKHLIDRELRKKGLRQKANSPDVLVAFGMGVDMEALQIKYNPKTNMKVLEDVPAGGLLLYFIEASSGFVVWAGAATAEVQDNPSIETVKARLDYVVTKMLKDFK